MINVVGKGLPAASGSTTRSEPITQMKTQRHKILKRKLPAQFTDSELDLLVQKLKELVDTTSPSQVPDFVIIYYNHGTGLNTVFSYGSEPDTAQDVFEILGTSGDFRGTPLDEIVLRRSSAHNLFL